MKRSALALALLAVALLAPPAQAGARPMARLRSCADQGVKVSAYNVTCAKARRVRRHLPSGWTGANIDTGGGEALLFRRSDFDQVTHAIRHDGSINRRLLGRVPLVVWSEPYGE